jgi:hypothetical protein
LAEFARHYVKGGNGDIPEPMLNRSAHGIRCFDPCLNCSTHAVGQMPLRLQPIAPAPGRIGGQRDRPQNSGMAAKERKERREFPFLCALCALLRPVLRSILAGRWATPVGRKNRQDSPFSSAGSGGTERGLG